MNRIFTFRSLTRLITLPLLLGACGQTQNGTTSATTSPTIPSAPGTEARVQAVTRWFQARRAGAYVMETRLDGAKKRVVPGWENFPTEHYSYSAGKLSAEAVVMPYDSARYARWVVRTCERLKSESPAEFPRPVEEYAQLLCWRILGQTSGIFAVAGVVIEDGKNYSFRDGVTVGIAGVTETGPSTSQLGVGQIANTIPQAGEDALWWQRITYIGRKSRLQGTNRPDSATFAVTPGAINWVKRTRDLYQAAWNDPSGHNQMMLEYARAELKESAFKKSSLGILDDLGLVDNPKKQKALSIQW